MKKNLILLKLVLFWVFLNGNVFGQDRNQYLLGQEQKLQIIVYVLGEVKNPGEYKVTDNTNLVELLSVAGGETQFSNLGAVSITRYESDPSDGNASDKGVAKKKVIKFNVKKYIEKKKDIYPPVLKPGDIIYVRRNRWYSWRNFATILRDLSVVASAYFVVKRSVE